MIRLSDNLLKIDNKTSSLLLNLAKPNVEIVYFGEKIRDYKGDFLGTEDGGYSCALDDATLYHSLFSFTGDGNNRESGLVLRSKNGVFVHLFVFDRVEIVDYENPIDMPHCKRKKETVRFTYRCINAPLSFYLFISTFEDSGVFAFSTELVNDGAEEVVIDRMMSLQLDLYSSREKIYTFDGAWARERFMHENQVKTGVFYVDSKTGVASACHNPFVLFESETYGYLALNLVYSGNHKEIVEHTERQNTRILTGINDYQFHYTLKGGERFCSPEAVLVRGNTTDETTSQMHAFVLEHIIPDRFATQERPVLVNIWEGTAFNFDKQLLLETADVASQLGIELLVIDDGWFGERNDEDCSLGDWYDNVKKTGGLKNLKEEFAKRNLKMGLWLEPEMISVKSKLYREHPEFAMCVPNLAPLERRNQLMLDLANPKVVEYVLQVLFDLIDEVRPAYIKWDYNRFISDAYSSCLENQGEYYHRYILGSYKMYREMTKRYPEILFEGCSGGGSRFDLGMLYYVPQIWCSDDTDARERLFIQEGTLYGYPQSTMGAHVTRKSNHLTHIPVSASDRFNVACIGAFGYELDLRRLTDEEKEEFKQQISLYKQYRRLLQFGEYYRLGNIFQDRTGGWIVLSKDKKEGVAMVVDQGRFVNQISPRFTFKGLAEDKDYEVTVLAQKGNAPIPSFSAGGDLLSKGLIRLGDLSAGENIEYGNGLHTRLLHLQIKE